MNRNDILNSKLMSKAPNYNDYGLGNQCFGPHFWGGFIKDGLLDRFERTLRMDKLNSKAIINPKVRSKMCKYLHVSLKFNLR